MLIYLDIFETCFFMKRTTVLDMSFYGLTMTDFIEAAFEVCKRNGVPNSFNKYNQLTREDFVRVLLKHTF